MVKKRNRITNIAYSYHIFSNNNFDIKGELENFDFVFAQNTAKRYDTMERTKVDGRGPKLAENQADLAMMDLKRRNQSWDLNQNRLKTSLSDLESQKVNNITAIDRDRRYLKQKFNSFRNTSGHYNSDNQIGNLYQNDQIRSKQTRKEKRENLEGFSKHDKSRFTSQTKDIPKLPSVAEKPGRSKSLKSEKFSSNLPAKSDKELQESQDLVLKVLDKSPTAKLARKDSYALGLLPQTRILSKSEQSLNAAWYTNIEEVRSNINKRLSTSMNDLEGAKVNDDDANDDDDDEITPYMHVPPDGLPRTMYMMPSFDDRFKEAMQARYIRKPGTKLDPIEKELDLNEIFNRKS